MGNEQSQVSGSNSFGFQVLKNTNDSLHLEPWFDFICGINGRQIDDGHSRLFQQEVRNCAGSAVTLSVWSAKGQRIREVIIPISYARDKLGITLQWSPLAVTDDVWHILDVAAGSPADISGLLPYNDYIIGTPSGIVRGESGLGELVEDHIDRPLVLFVWNAEFDATREVTIVPRRHWGGEGALGAVLGYGAIHRLPPPFTEPVGEAMFEAPGGPDESDQANQPTAMAQTSILFSNPRFQEVPVSSEAAPPPMSAPTAPTSTTRPGKHKSRHHHHHHHNPQNTNFANAMDQYMQEEESKSRAQDYQVSDSTAAAGSLPPPPTLGAEVAQGQRPPPPHSSSPGPPGLPPPPMRSPNPAGSPQPTSGQENNP